MSDNIAALWLKEQRTTRNLSFREMARQMGTGITHTTLSDAERGVATPETWKQIAEHFKTPAITVLQWSGFLEAIPTKDQLIEQIDNDLNRMSPDGRKVAAGLIRSLLESQ